LAIGFLLLPASGQDTPLLGLGGAGVGLLEVFLKNFTVSTGIFYLFIDQYKKSIVRINQVLDWIIL